ncbi:hypothetical protein ACJW31_04G166500 [Castanea mollissima]
MTLEGTILLFLIEYKKWNTSYWPGPEAPFGGGGGGCATRLFLGFGISGFSTSGGSGGGGGGSTSGGGWSTSGGGWSTSGGSCWSSLANLKSWPLLCSTVTNNSFPSLALVNFSIFSPEYCIQVITTTYIFTQKK